MNLIHNWAEVLRKAWSLRLILLAGVLSGLETILPIFTDIIPRGLFSVLTVVVVCAAFIARLIAQRNLDSVLKEINDEDAN